MSGWVNGDFSSAEQRPFLLPPPSSGSSPKEETHSHARDKLLLSNQDLEEPWQGSPLCESFEKGDVLTTFFFCPFLLAHKACWQVVMSSTNHSSSSYCLSPLECLQVCHRALWLRMKELPGTVPLFPSLSHKDCVR